MPYTEAYTKGYTIGNLVASDFSLPVEVTTAPAPTDDLVVGDVAIDVDTSIVVIDPTTVPAGTKWRVVLEIDGSTGETVVVGVSHA